MEIYELITTYGMNRIILAECICIATGLLKLPVKKFAAKCAVPEKITKYITFLPVILGGGFTAVYYLIMKQPVIFDGKYVALWLSSSSLSLAIYAFIEKFFPKRQVITSQEILENSELIETLEEKFSDALRTSNTAVEKPRIIIKRGKEDGKTET